MLSLSIPELLAILLNILITIVKIALIFLIGWLGGNLFRWLWRSLIVPIFQRRAYFYAFKEDDEGFYVERPLKFLWIKLRRNKRWALQKDLVGYVAKASGSSESDQGGGGLSGTEYDIYFQGFANRTHVGQVRKPKEIPVAGGGKIKICEVILKRSNIEGDTYYDTPVGFINSKGEVYKYYKDRKSALKGKKLEEAELIGYARAPQLQERKSFPGEYDTDAAAAADGIDNTDISSEWFFFRKRKKSKVKSQKISSPATNKGYLAFWTAGWRVLHAHLLDTNPDRKLRPWGVGYAVEDFWRNLFTSNADGFGLDARAVAALLLAEKEGFYLRDSEHPAEGKKGLWPTALLSLVCYLCIFPMLNRWEALECWFEGLVGPQISKAIALILLFFGLWLIIHIIRLLFYDATDRFESLLNKMNNNVGTTRWNTLLIVTSAIGLILSIFMVDYLFSPIFFCALVVTIGTRVVFGATPWYVEYPIKESDQEKEEEKDDDKDKDGEDADEEIEHSATIFTTGDSFELKFKIPYSQRDLKGLRASNPFRDGNTADYAGRVREMILKEYGDEVYSRIKFVKGKVERFADKHNLSYIEKINLILKLSQPDNIKYQYDWNCEELLPHPDEAQPADFLLKDRDKPLDGKGYVEYCRYPSETLHDQRGDCDCHAALAVALLAACGIRCCYFTNQTDDDTGHAALGIEINDELNPFINTENRFEYNEKKFIYVEATGSCCQIGEVPPGFASMLLDQNKGTYAIVEPANFDIDNNEE